MLAKEWKWVSDVECGYHHAALWLASRLVASRQKALLSPYWVTPDSMHAEVITDAIESPHRRAE